jgi:predicted nucleic acid-binding protein
MIVVSDTSPLNYLVLVGAIDVLPDLFGEVYAPPAVLVELQHPRTPDVVKDWSQAPPNWLRIQTPSPNATRDPKLDPGEADAIALALEMGASAVLVDEKKGRRTAIAQGLAVLSTLTVLELAADRDLLDLRATLDALQATTFHCTQALIDDALKRHDNSRRA